MRRLSISLVLVVVLSVVGTGWIVGLVYEQLQQGKYSQEMQEYELAGYLLASIIDTSSEEDHSGAIRTAAEKGLLTQVITRDDLPLPASLQENFDKGEALVLEADGNVTLYFNMPVSGRVLALRTVLQHETRSRLNLVLTLAFYAIVVAVLLFWLYPLIKRLRHLDKAANLFGDGDLDSRVEPQSASYIHGIEQSFNKMADRIQLLLEDNKLLSRAVSHDLKTPLARLRFGIDALSESRDADRREHYQQRIDQDLEEMESLVSTLLQYAALEDDRPTIQSEIIDLEALCEQKFSARGTDEVSFRIEHESAAKAEENRPRYCARTDERYLSMLLNNLVSNACNYAKSEVVLSLALQADDIVIEVHDDGPGVPADQRERIFKPFQRGTQSNQVKGHGMGLAIASRITSWLNADLTVRDSQRLGGALFTLRLPTN